MNIRKLAVGVMLTFSMTLVFFSINALASQPTELDRILTAMEAEMRIETGYINAPTVRLRAEGNLDARVIANLNYGAKLIILDEEGEWYKVARNGSVGFVFNEFVTLGEIDWTARNDNVEMLDWWDGGQSKMRPGTLATITDVATGIQYRIRILYGTNHADAEPLTAYDTAKKKETRNGNWSWDPRAILVTLENGRTFAASANSVPHGGSSISDNDFPGHFCIHFLNSSAHGSNRINPGHQSQIKMAFNAS
ncbi:MAG: SH3 domain-containing protein [Defluviitaleaceae bacterium]|nr:SH3 domain-containing protein [Defluviitaleaceae bacterium]